MPFREHDSSNFPDIDYIQRWFDSHVEHFLKDAEFDSKTEVTIDLAVAQEVLKMYFSDMDRYKDFSGIDKQSVFKKMGHLAFWIRKLKPITNVEPVHPEFGNKVNEIFALTLALLYCNNAQENPRVGLRPILHAGLWHDLLFFFRYKSVSPHALTMLLNAMYTVQFKTA